MAIQWQKIFLQPQTRVQLPPQASHFYNHARIRLKTGEAPLVRRLSS